MAPLSAPCLVALFHATSALGVAPFRALLLPCSRAPSPAPVPSCRQSEPKPCLTRTANGRNRPPCAPLLGSDDRGRRTPAETGDSWPKPPASKQLPKPARERPRLQGFAPHESPPLAAGGLDRRRARSSPGLHTLQGSLPRWNGAAFTASPLMGFLRATASAAERPALQGLASSEIGLSLSRLPALLGFAAS
jgi:hypothetical protein